MTRRNTKRKLSSGEMEILSMLWEHGRVSLSQAHAALERPIGYTTVQTRLNRLVEKGLVRRTKDRPALYEAVLSPADVSANHLDVLLERVTGGNVVPLVAHLVKDRKLSLDEIDELREIIASAEEQLSSTDSTGVARSKRGAKSRRQKGKS